MSHNEDLKLVMNKIPNLSNIDVKSISMDATVNGDTLSDNKITIVITGTDSNGTSHEITLALNTKVSDIGNTKVDTSDTTGKQVATIDEKEQHHNRIDNNVFWRN